MTIAYCVFVVAILPYVWSMAWRWQVYRLKANLSPGVSKRHQRAGVSIRIGRISMHSRISLPLLAPGHL